MVPASEEDLLLGTRFGDPGSLEKLYTLTRDRLFTVVRRVGVDPATADDLVHEVYLRLWDRRARIPEVASAMAYLCAMARNLWKNQRKHHGAVQRMLGMLVERKRSGQVSRPSVDEREDIAEALLTLDEDPREVFTLHRFAGLSYREIAQVQGVSLKTVEARMRRAFDDLRPCLKSYVELERETP